MLVYISHKYPERAIKAWFSSSYLFVYLFDLSIMDNFVNYYPSNHFFSYFGILKNTELL
jgi:hypothetical protein